MIYYFDIISSFNHIVSKSRSIYSVLGTLVTSYYNEPREPH